MFDTLRMSIISVKTGICGFLFYISRFERDFCFSKFIYADN